MGLLHGSSSGRGEQEAFGSGCVEGVMSVGHPGRDAENTHKVGTGNVGSESLAHVRGWSTQSRCRGPGRKFRAGGEIEIQTIQTPALGQVPSYCVAQRTSARFVISLQVGVRA